MSTKPEMWICGGCKQPNIPPPDMIEKRGIKFYKRLVFTVIIPLLLVIFWLVALGITIGA